MNFGTGSRAASTKVPDDALSRVDMHIFARLMRSRCATLSPVIIDMLVLSDDRIVPKSVAPLGRSDCVGSNKSFKTPCINETMHLHFPCIITCHPLRVHTAQPLGSGIHPARRKV